MAINSLGPLPTPVGSCVIYTGLVLEQTDRLFFCLIDCCDQFVFSSPFLFCCCLAEIVIEHIDRSAVGSIDLQGQSPGQWKMALQCPPVLSLQHPCGASFLFLNLSLTSFHLSVLLEIHVRISFNPSSFSHFWVCGCCRSEQRWMVGRAATAPAGSERSLYESRLCHDITL